MNVIEITAEKKPAQETIRLAAYCRVSSDSEDQLHSFAAQIRYYKDYERRHPQYKLVDIYADEGITGTCMDKRDDLHRLIRDCKKGLIDRIIVKSVSRFARNTQELLATIRFLKDIGVSIYFEEQGIDTDKLNSEMIVTFPGMAAQQESESISGNMRWSYKKRMESGDFNCCAPAYGFDLVDGDLVINKTEAAVVRRVFSMYLQGYGKQAIANKLNEESVPRRHGTKLWYAFGIDYMLNNERYMGDALLQKKYTTDTLPFKKVKNRGERPKYYVENANPAIVSRETYSAVQELQKSRQKNVGGKKTSYHPAIIDSATFGRVQEEMARRCGKRKVKQVGTKTEQGRYSSKYALTELLICGECGTPYRRCTWAANGKKKVVWRCINRLDYGKKYCHYSPSIEESVLQEAIMKAVMQTAKQNAEVLKTLKLHIGMGLSAGTTEDNSLDLQIRIAEIEAEFQKMLKAIAADNVEAFDEEKAKALMDEKAKLQIQLDRIADTKQKRENAKSRLDEIFTIIEALANHPISYDDQIVRQILESVIVESKEKIKVVFVGGLEVTQTI